MIWHMLGNILENLRMKLSSTKILPIQWLISLSGILMIRFFLESLSSPTSSGVIASDAPTLLHYFLFYLSVALGLMLLLQWMIPTWKKVLPQVILFVMTLTFIPPIIDWIMSGGKGMRMAYLFQSPYEMVKSFFTFFGSFTPAGITLGIRMELALLIIGVGLLVFIVRKSRKMALISAISLYIVAFVAVSIPGIISAVSGIFGSHYSGVDQFIQTSILHSSTLADNIHATLRYGSLTRMLEIGFDFMISRIWFIISTTLIGAWFYTNFKRQTVAILKNLRPERIGHYIFLVLLGAIVAYQQNNFSMNWNDWLVLFTLALSFYFSWMFAVGVNDIYDVDIDRVSNGDRPIIENGANVEEMKTASLLFLVLSLVSAYLAGYYAFFCILAFTALYFVYSAPPVRLKRVPFLSVFVIGFCSLTAIMAGFFTFSTVKIVSTFPPSWIIGIVIFFSLLPQVKDIKDIEGDRAAGIMTVPTLYGPVWGPRVVGAMAAIAYLIIPLLAHNSILWIGAVPAAVLSYMICIGKPFKERPIFIVYGLFAIFLGVILLA